MNLLLPSIGNKVDLARLLGAAVHERGGRLLGSDLSPDAAALALVDMRVELPRFDDAGFWDVFAAVARDVGIDAVVPARNEELPQWARRAEAGELTVRLLLSTERTLRICLDKAALYAAAESAGIRCPPWQPADAWIARPAVQFPVILKPVSGSGSRGIHVARDSNELVRWIEHLDRPYLVQKHKVGREFSVDCFATTTGLLDLVFVRERTQVQKGQCTIGTPVDDPELVSLCRSLARELHFRGVVNFQFIRDGEGAWLIDLNPRFPGGIAQTESAGFAFCERTVAALAGIGLSGA